MAAPDPQISVVAATHNRAERLAALLDSLRTQTVGRPFEVVIVDDGSGDATPRVLAGAQAASDLDLRVVRNDPPRGRAGARNVGWRAARAPLVAFIDDDCVADPGWLEAGVRAAEESPGTIVQGRTGPIPDELPMDLFSRTVVVEKDGPYYETCNIFYPRALVERLGGFDEVSFPGFGGEDTDLAWRAIRQGVQTRYEPEARVFHAVVRMGPVGMLRYAAGWSQTMQIFALYPEIRGRHLHKGVFWHWSHYGLLRVLVALLLPRRWYVLRRWLAHPYTIYLLRDHETSVLLAPYVALRDLVELVSVVHGAVRHRTFVL